MAEVQAAAPAAQNTPAPATPGIPGQSAITNNTPETKSVGGVEAKPVETPAGAEQLYEMKIDGKMRRLTLEDLKAEASKSISSNARFEEAAKMKKTSEGLIQAFLAGDARTFEAIANAAGLSKEEAIARFEKAYKAAVIDPETMTEEEKLRAENQRLKKEREDEKAAEEAAKQEEKQKALDHHTRMQLQTDLIQGLESSGLPKNRFTLGRMAFYMKQNLNRGYDAPMEVIVRQVKQEREAIVQQQAQGSSIEQLIELLGGEELIEKIRQYDIAKLKGSSPAEKSGLDPEAPVESHRTAGGKRKSRPMSDVDKFFKEMRMLPRQRRSP